MWIRQSTDSLFVYGNYGEAVLWAVVALLVAGYGWRRRGVLRARCWVAAAVLIAFGLSDVVEVQTGAWWRPWWLFVWKVVCVLTLAALLLDGWRRTRPAARDS
jgi:hypothetical protein